MKTKLALNAAIKYISGLILVGLLLFLPAGTLRYPGGWRFIVLLFLPMLILGIVMLWKAPDLLQKRLQAKESEEEQKKVVAWSGLMFLLGFLAAGLDFRFAVSHVPQWLVIVASVLLLISYGLYAEVMRENAYLSRTVEVQEGQKVVDTGLYGIVRHPMYAVTILLFLMIPLVLGSWLCLLCFLTYPVAILHRIRNEEQVLTEGLEGYAQYKQRVKYRVIPFIY